MKNLTLKQNEIISNLVAEFTKINESHCVKSSSNPLLNIANEFDSAKNKDIIDRASIEAKNKSLIKDNQEICELDAYDIKCLLDELGKGLKVRVEHSASNSYIYIKSDKWSGPIIKYTLPILGRESYKYLDSINVLGSTAVFYGGYAYHNYIDVLNSKDFKDDFIELLNRD